jgi:hypothetical protein
MALPQVSAADGQDERVAGGPGHESQHRRVLRMGGDDFLESRRRGARRAWAFLQRVAVCADPDDFQSVHRSVRDRRLSPRRQGAQESQARSGRESANLISDTLLRTHLSCSFRLPDPSRSHGPPDVLPHRPHDDCAVPAGLRSAAAVHRGPAGAASRNGSVAAARVRIGRSCDGSPANWLAPARPTLCTCGAQGAVPGTSSHFGQDLVQVSRWSYPWAITR